MARYIARRLAFGVFLVFAVSSATLLLASLAPGDYVTESFGAGVSAETAARARVRYGLDQTILEQYGRWLVRASRFDFGRSTRQSGTYRFKRQWGAEEEPLYWYRIAIDAHQSRSETSMQAGPEWLARMWQQLPLSVTRQVGPQLRRYLIQ